MEVARYGCSLITTTLEADPTTPYLKLSMTTISSRPQRDDLLELERQLAKLGLESKRGGARVRARHRLAEGQPPHLSSALGDSFFFLNKSVIFGGAGATAAGGLAGGMSSSNTCDNGGAAGPPLATRATPVDRGSVGGAAVTAETALDSNGRTGSSTMPSGGTNGGGTGIAHAAAAATARGIRGAGGEARLETQGSDGTRHPAGEVGRGASDAESGRGGRGEGLSEESGSRPPLVSAEAETRRAEEETQQGEIMRLLTCLKTLGDENVSLMKECEDRDKASWRWWPFCFGCCWRKTVIDPFPPTRGKWSSRGEGWDHSAPLITTLDLVLCSLSTRTV